MTEHRRTAGLTVLRHARSRTTGTSVTPQSASRGTDAREFGIGSASAIFPAYREIQLRPGLVEFT